MNRNFSQSTAARIGVLVIFLIVMGFLGVRIFSLLRERADQGQSLKDLNTKLEQAKIDQSKLQEELQYLSRPTNLEKELRSRFNYRAPGEKMIIIVPDQSSTSSTNP